MASIFKRRGKYSVVYRYTDEEGKERQKWETFSTEKEAKARKRQVEQKMADHSFVVPTAKTLHDLLEEYLAHVVGTNPSIGSRSYIDQVL